jgi:hypothetical protein
MISSLKRLVIGTAAIIGFAASAQAAFVPASWSENIGGNTYVDAGQWHVYQHDIKGDGFRPLQDLVTDFTLTIDLFDDSKDKGIFRGETAQIFISSLPTSIFGSSVGDKVFQSDVFDFSLTNGWTFSGLLELNALGTLTVGITSLWGDFVVGDSSLVANGYSNTPAQVPEPGTIALLGLGLLGVGFGRRKLAK